MKRLVLQAVDPELLEAVVGPQLAPAWVKPLRAQYVRFKQAYPADWMDVEKVWREQQAQWRSKAGPHHEQPPARAVPPRAPAPAAGAANKTQQQQTGYDRWRIARSRAVASITRRASRTLSCSRNL